MAAANGGGGGGGHVRSKSEPVIVPGELQQEPTRAPEGLRHRSISMDSFDFYFRGNKKAEFMESSYQSMMQAVEDWRERRRAFMENLFSRLPEPIDFSTYIDYDDDYDEDDYDIDDGSSADGDPDHVDEDGDDDGASADGDPDVPDVDEVSDDDGDSADGDDDDDEDEDDLNIDGDDDGDGPDVAPAA